MRSVLSVDLIMQGNQINRSSFDWEKIHRFSCNDRRNLIIGDWQCWLNLVTPLYQTVSQQNRAAHGVPLIILMTLFSWMQSTPPFVIYIVKLLSLNLFKKEDKIKLYQLFNIHLFFCIIWYGHSTIHY